MQTTEQKFKTLAIAVACCAVVATTGVGVGCYFAGKSDGAERIVSTSYVSTDSKTYCSTADIVAAVAESVVEIRTETVQTAWGAQYIVSGAGSGVIVAENNDGSYNIITNNHVIDGARNITVALRSSVESGVEYTAKLVATDPVGDIAVISIETTKKLNVADWGDSDKLSIGEDLIAIGNPLGSLGGTVTKGILSATERRISVGNYPMTLLQTDTAINPGNSGGGLFNMNGDLIGIVNAKTSDEEVEGICFAIPANTAIDIYDDLVKYGYVVGRSTLGVKVAATNNFAYVAQVGDAADGTFKAYDKIHTINGKSVATLLEYNTMLAEIKPGDKVTVEVFRCTQVTSGIFGIDVQYDTAITSFEVTAKQAK